MFVDVLEDVGDGEEGEHYEVDFSDQFPLPGFVAEQLFEVFIAEVVFAEELFGFVEVDCFAFGYGGGFCSGLDDFVEAGFGFVLRDGHRVGKLYVVRPAWALRINKMLMTKTEQRGRSPGPYLAPGSGIYLGRFAILNRGHIIRRLSGSQDVEAGIHQALLRSPLDRHTIGKHWG